ncbi:MAG: hypothetical protein H7274_10040 [Rhodoferax sp.]|nr:hypothetical protein [Rhodoferax sp.]
MDTVKIWVEDNIEVPTTKSALPSLGRAAISRSIEVGAEVLQDSIRSFSQQFTGLLDGRPLGDNNAVIDEVELSLVITASGGIELLGKLSVGAQAGIKVKLKRAK